MNSKEYNYIYGGYRCYDAFEDCMKPGSTDILNPKLLVQMLISDP